MKRLYLSDQLPIEKWGELLGLLSDLETHVEYGEPENFPRLALMTFRQFLQSAIPNSGKDSCVWKREEVKTIFSGVEIIYKTDCGAKPTERDGVWPFCGNCGRIVEFAE